MRAFMAGAARIGPEKASASWVSTLSAWPPASFASVLAESGRDDEQVGSRQVRVELTWRLPPCQRLEGVHADEPLGLGGQDRRHLVARLHQQPAELTGLVGGDAAGDAEDDAGHPELLSDGDASPWRNGNPAGSPGSRTPGGGSGPALGLDLALCDLLEGDRQVVLRARLHERRREVVERALAELVVVVVDLARALRGDDDQRVARAGLYVRDQWNRCAD